MRKSSKQPIQKYRQQDQKSSYKNEGIKSKSKRSIDQKSQSKRSQRSKTQTSFNDGSNTKNKHSRKDKASRMTHNRKQKLNRNKKTQASNDQQNFNESQDINDSKRNALVQKQKLLNLSTNQQIQLLKQLHNKIILAPEDQLKHIQTIFAMLKLPNLKVVAKSLRVLAQIFINISPMEPINLDEIQQRISSKLKKQQYQVVNFQKTLVKQYERYLNLLKQLNSKIRPENMQNDQQLYTQFKKCILECVVKLYRTLWNFNFNKQLCQLCLKFLRFQECQSFLKEMLQDKNIAVIGAKAKIIQGISKVIKNERNQSKLPQGIIKLVNFTYIDTRYLKKDEQSIKYRKKQLKKKLYRQEAMQKKKEKQNRAQKGTLEMKRQKRQQKIKQKLRVKQQVNKQFAQGEATIKNKELVRYNSKILQQLFYIYFKILVQKLNSLFLKDCLDGILKFVHLINIDLTKDLIQHLDTSAATFRELWLIKKSNQILQSRVLLVFTGQSIINGPLSIFNMDDAKMISHLYKIFKDINTHKDVKITKQLYRLLCISLEQSFIKRRQLSQEVVGSFLRQIALMLRYKQNIPKNYLLEVIRCLAHRYSKLTRMFQQDNQGFGLNSFNPACEDPHCSNAINTQIISFLRQIKSKKPQNQNSQEGINKLIEKLCKQNFLPKDLKQSLYDILQRQMYEYNF